MQAVKDLIADGTYNEIFDVGLTVPADTLAGDYAGTLTVTFTAPV